jgi:hypothetical protein
MRDFAWPGVGQDLGQRDDARLTDVRRVVAGEVALNLVKGIRSEQLDKIRRDVTQDRLPGPERARRTSRATLIYSSARGRASGGLRRRQVPGVA